MSFSRHQSDQVMTLFDTLWWLSIAFKVKDKLLTWSTKHHMVQLLLIFRPHLIPLSSRKLPALATLLFPLFLILTTLLPTPGSLQMLFPLPGRLSLPLCLVDFHSSRITSSGEPSRTSLTLRIFSSFSWNPVFPFGRAGHHFHFTLAGEIDGCHLPN